MVVQSGEATCLSCAASFEVLFFQIFDSRPMVSSFPSPPFLTHSRAVLSSNYFLFSPVPAVPSSFLPSFTYLSRSYQNFIHLLTLDYSSKHNRKSLQSFSTVWIPRRPRLSLRVSGIRNNYSRLLIIDDR